MENKKYSLLHKPKNSLGIYQSLSVKKAGWNLLNFSARIIKKGQKWKKNTGNYEYGIILFTLTIIIFSISKLLMGEKVFFMELLIRYICQEIQILN